MADVIDFKASNGGLYSLASLPQRPPLTQTAFGVGWWELDQIFKFFPGQFVVLTGLAGHGKSTFLMNCLVRAAKDQGVNCFLYVPENEVDLKNKLRLLWPGDDASFAYFAEKQCVVQTSLNDEQPRTMAWVLSQAAKVVHHEKTGIVVIDPWNELDRAKPPDMLLSEYIGYSLMDLKDFCRQLNVSVAVVAHPTKAVNENGGRIAGLADIEGSMNWFNKCDNGLIVVREKNNTTRVISAKVRHCPDSGRLGQAYFYVDPNTGVFTPQHGAVTP